MWSQNVTPVGKLAVLLALAHHADSRTYECWPSAGRLAEMVGLHERSVRRYLDDLDAEGVITKLYRRRVDVPGKRKAQLSTWQYRLNIDRELPDTSVTDSDGATGHRRPDLPDTHVQSYRTPMPALNSSSELPDEQTPPTPPDDMEAMRALAVEAGEVYVQLEMVRGANVASRERLSQHKAKEVLRDCRDDLRAALDLIRRCSEAGAVIPSSRVLCHHILAGTMLATAQRPLEYAEADVVVLDTTQARRGAPRPTERRLSRAEREALMPARYRKGALA